MSYKKTINIKGMHCRSCEILLEEQLGSIEGVKKVRVNHKKGIADIEAHSELSDSKIESAVHAAGYTLGVEDKKHFFSRNPADYVELAAVGIIVVIIYLLLERFGVFAMNANVNAAPSVWGVLLIGLTAGISTCMALVGGLVLGVSARHAEIHPEATPAQKFRPHIFFNLGRLLSYVVLGGIMGLIGSVFTFSSTTLGIIILVLGFVMLILGMKLTEVFPRLHNKTIALPKAVSRLLGVRSEVKEYSHRGAFITGALTFFVPCGFTQAMQLYAVSTGSFTSGALIMGMFALGTLPGIIGVGGLTSAIKGAFARYFFKFAGVVVIFLAIFNIANGYTLTGWNLGKYVSFKKVAPTEEVALKDGKQVVEMVQGAGGYSPRQFTVKKGVPVVWKITSTTQYSCAAYIRMPAAKIAKPLNPGVNIIEFTPTQVGPMKFTCSMGMYSGVFNVVE